MKGNELYDNHSNRIAIVKGNDIYDNHSNKIATMSDVRRAIESGIGGTTLAALWICFVR